MERIKRIEYNKPDISQPQNTINVDFYNINTPEIYFGYKFSRGNFGNPEGIKPNQIVDYKFPSSITSNNAYFEGKWKSNEDNMELADDEGSILLIFKAKSANIIRPTAQMLLFTWIMKLKQIKIKAMMLSLRRTTVFPR